MSRIFYSLFVHSLRVCWLGIAFFYSQIALGQTNVNQNRAFWTEVNIGGKIKGKFSYQLDYQFRRQGESDKIKQVLQNQLDGKRGKLTVFLLILINK